MILISHRLNSDPYNNQLKLTAAHELFHHCEADSLSDIPLLRFAKNSLAEWKGFGPFMEACAEDAAQQVFTPTTSGQLDFGVRLLHDTGPEGRTGYDAYLLFRYARTHLNTDLTWKMWAGREVASNLLQLVGFENAREYLYRRFRETSMVLGPRKWTDFAFALQYSASDAWIPTVRIGSGRRASVPTANLLTGNERAEANADDGEVGPLLLRNMFYDDPHAVSLKRGQIASFAVNPICDPDTVHRPCTERRAAAPTSTWSIVFHTTGLAAGSHMRGTVYRMPLGAPPPSDAMPEALLEFSAAEGDVELEVPLALVGDYDQLVVSFVNDPDLVGATETFTLDTFFRGGGDDVVYYRMDNWTAQPRGLFTAAVDGSGETQILYEPGEHYDCPVFSPDRSRIAFGTQDGAGLHYWVINKDGTQRREVAPGLLPTSRCPLWHPNGAQFYARMGTNEVLVNVATGETTPVVAMGTCVLRDVSFDGTLGLCVEPSDEQIYRIDMSTGVKTKLTFGPYGFTNHQVAFYPYLVPGCTVSACQEFYFVDKYIADAAWQFELFKMRADGQELIGHMLRVVGELQPGDARPPGFWDTLPTLAPDGVNFITSSYYGFSSGNNTRLYLYAVQTFSNVEITHNDPDGYIGDYEPHAR